MNFKKCIFHTPDGKTLFLNDISHLKAEMIDDFKNYWSPGSGDRLNSYDFM